MPTIRSTASRPLAPFPLESDPSRRLLGLDVLRGLSILLVVCGHLQFRMPPTSFGFGFWTHTRQLALTGVDLFLVLSGFLIGGMLFNEFNANGRVALGRFFGRRAWRLLPVYLLAILLGWKWYHWVRVIDEGKVVRGVRFWGMWPYFALVPNYYNIIQKNYGAAAVLQAWTLAVIVHFYVLFALLMTAIAAVGRRALRVIPWVTAASFALCLWARWHNASPAATYKYEPYHNYFETHLRLDECFFGVLLAYWVTYYRPQVNRVVQNLWPVIAAVALMALGVIAFRKDEAPRWLVIVGFPMAGVAAGALMLVIWWWEMRLRERAATANTAEARRSVGARLALLPVRALAWVGVWSYCIYFSHQPVVEYLSIKVRDQIGRRLHLWESPYMFTTAMLAYVGLAIVAGAVLYFAVERPALILRDRWFAKRGAAAAREGQPVESRFVTASATVTATTSPSSP